jgi:hypothetical protein
MPNPASQSATVVVPDATEVRQFRLFDLTGREVLRRRDVPGNNFEIELNGLAPGIYLFNADGRVGKLAVE